MSNYNKFVEVLEKNFLGASIDNVTDDEIIDTLHENGLACTLRGSKYYLAFNEYEIDIKEAGAYIVFSFENDECVSIYWSAVYIIIFVH